jgi:methionyl-tRNA formyltransferase
VAALAALATDACVWGDRCTRVRTLFFGTPGIALPALRALAATTEVVGVVCQPDRPKGRGLELAEPPVKVAARALGIEVHQPIKVKTGNLDEWVRDHHVDVAVVLAYGRILPASVLAAARRGGL